MSRKAILCVLASSLYFLGTGPGAYSFVIPGRYAYPERWGFGLCATPEKAPEESDSKKEKSLIWAAPEDDTELLKMVKKSELADLCEQCGVSKKGKKRELLLRLREFAEKRSEECERERAQYAEWVERGYGSSVSGKLHVNEEKVSKEVASRMEKTADASIFVNFRSRDDDRGRSKEKKGANNDDADAESQTKKKKITPVTVYNTEDVNDLTGVAATQPTHSDMSDNILAPSESESSPDWKDGIQQKSVTTSKDLEEAKETVTELVHSLLVTTGAPGFGEEFSQGLQPYSEQQKSPTKSKKTFDGFDPSKVSPDVLLSSSKALRAGRGEVLKEVLYNFEIRAVGLDGMAGDDKEKGGGHYHVVEQVRAFLEGFRRAEVKRICRETTAILLNKVAKEGVEGLDMLLGSMARANDDTGEAGELSDSLLEFLNDVIRQQERKVNSEGPKLMNSPDLESESFEDPTEDLWKVSDVDGVRMETIDPNNPDVKEKLKEEIQKARQESMKGVKDHIPKSAPAKVLLLLKLLRDRVKAEAAYPNDDHGRNLRILAYCLRFDTDQKRKTLIMKELKNSLMRLQAFCELVESSIEYAKNPKKMLQPSSRMLNIPLLKRILEIALECKREQETKASAGGIASGVAGYKP